LAQPLLKKPTVGFFVARNLRFSTAKQSEIAAIRRKAKTSGVSTKCIFAFDSPPFVVKKSIKQFYITERVCIVG